ncbi:MAG: hypothetical protein M1320_01250 [Patescibacteria group bacterium]|nr:hypothetical protein [Patescibacteria group bacterium]
MKSSPAPKSPKIVKVTYEAEELEQKIRYMIENSDNPDAVDSVEMCCYPDTDGCCIKKGAVSNV